LIKPVTLKPLHLVDVPARPTTLVHSKQDTHQDTQQDTQQCSHVPPTIYQALWTSLHVSSFYIDQYQSHDMQAQQGFITHVASVKDFLPCTNCADHMIAYLASNPMPAPGLYAVGAFVFARWVVALHNDVNLRQGKPQVAFETVKAHYVNDGPPPQCPAMAGQPKQASSQPASSTNNNNSNDLFKRLHVHHILGAFGISMLLVIIIVAVGVTSRLAR
jgi:hypothetical protein